MISARSRASTPQLPIKQTDRALLCPGQRSGGAERLPEAAPSVPAGIPGPCPWPIPSPGPRHCARPCAPSGGSGGRAPAASCRGSPFLSTLDFLYVYINFFLRPFSHSCRKRKGGGGGREKYCLNSQRGASGAPCAWHLRSLCPEQRARTGARGRRGRRASVGRHNKVTKQRRGPGPAALPSQRGTRGCGSQVLCAG